jgi:hypothetical protein
MPNRMEAPEPEAVEPEASTETEETPETTEAPESWSLSQDDWNSLQENQKIMVGALRELYEARGQQPPTEEEVDDEDLDLGQMIQKYVDSRFSEVTPVLQQVQEKEGRETMNQLFEQAKKDPSIGDFDTELAERAAHAFFTNEGRGDPQAAQWAALQGAKYAANYRKQERQAGIKEYTDSLSKDTFDDGVAGVGGIRAGKPFATMDEAIEAWSGQEEV